MRNMPSNPYGCSASTAVLWHHCKSTKVGDKEIILVITLSTLQNSPKILFHNRTIHFFFLVLMLILMPRCWGQQSLYQHARLESLSAFQPSGTVYPKPHSPFHSHREHRQTVMRGWRGFSLWRAAWVTPPWNYLKVLSISELVNISYFRH